MMDFGFTSFSMFGWFFMVFWWVLIIVGIAALIKWFTDKSSDGHDYRKTPIDILKERYAKGEINREELKERIQEIKNL